MEKRKFNFFFILIPLLFFFKMGNRQKKEKREKRRKTKKELVIPRIFSGITSHRRIFMVSEEVLNFRVASLGAT